MEGFSPENFIKFLFKLSVLLFKIFQFTKILQVNNFFHFLNFYEIPRIFQCGILVLNLIKGSIRAVFSSRTDMILSFSLCAKLLATPRVPGTVLFSLPANNLTYLDFDFDVPLIMYH